MKLKALLFALTIYSSLVAEDINKEPEHYGELLTSIKQYHNYTRSGNYSLANEIFDSIRYTENESVFGRDHLEMQLRLIEDSGVSASKYKQFNNNLIFNPDDFTFSISGHPYFLNAKATGVLILLTKEGVEANKDFGVIKQKNGKERIDTFLFGGAVLPVIYTKGKLLLVSYRM